MAINDTIHHTLPTPIIAGGCRVRRAKVGGQRSKIRTSLKNSRQPFKTLLKQKLALSDSGDGMACLTITRRKYTTVRGFIKEEADGEFDPAVISVLEAAFEDAWRQLQANKPPCPNEEYARTIIAGYIIGRARAGERDPRSLADTALLYLSKQKLSRTPPKDIIGLFSATCLAADLLLRGLQDAPVF